MAIRVARQGQDKAGMTGMVSGRLACAMAVVLGCCFFPGGTARAQTSPQLPNGCVDFKLPAGMQEAIYPLPNITRALSTNGKIKILAIGDSASTNRSLNRDYSSLIENYLETSVKGLDVDVIDRGVSGELAARAAERIKFEVALNEPNLVLWQVGTFDAMAQVPLLDFKHTLTKTIAWLRKHNADLVMVSLHYQRGLRTNESYQAFRKLIEETAAQEKVLRIGRYEAEELVDKVQSTTASPVDKFQMTENGYDCLSQFVVRALATSLFAKKAPDETSPQRKP
jgi:acyl-CoA thioesterase I